MEQMPILCSEGANIHNYPVIMSVDRVHFLLLIWNAIASGLRVRHQYERAALVKVENGSHFQLMRIGSDGLKALVGRILHLGRDMAL